MSIKKFAILATTLLLMLFALAVAAAAADQLSGTWKINPAKSKYSPGPAPKSLTVKVDSDENNFNVSADGTDADGKPTHVAYNAKFDGKDYAVEGDSTVDMRAYTQVDERTLTMVNKKNGKVVSTGRIAVSADGKTRTVTVNGKTAAGKKYKSVAVYHRD